ncbi:hypothetical protein M569_01945 [Genlisea aurea]|uniref:Myb-like domain-containing protein n=1 Tax=Genlisea aurea TaxID=192259 RepID=S8EJN4_9LAMI|nr:hypothetical protein M569_01945 [Genlisea aurea]
MEARVHRKNLAPRRRRSAELSSTADGEDSFRFRNRKDDSDSDRSSAVVPKPRLRWTPELHGRFLKAVHELGGPNKATPKGILNTMEIDGISLHHLKSHLQKFRLGKFGRRLWKKEQFLSAEFYGEFSNPIPLQLQRSWSSSSDYLTNPFAAEADQIEIDYSCGKMDDEAREELILQFGNEFSFSGAGGRRDQISFPMHFDNELMKDYLNSLNKDSDGFTAGDGDSGAGN